MKMVVFRPPRGRFELKPPVTTDKDDLGLFMSFEKFSQLDRN